MKEFTHSEQQKQQKQTQKRRAGTISTFGIRAATPTRHNARSLSRCLSRCVFDQIQSTGN